VYEHIIAAFFALDETEALGCVEELYDAAALADDLGRHSAATAATAGSAEAATAAAARAAEAAAITAAAAEAVTAAETTAVTTATAEAIAAATEVAAAAEAITAAAEATATTAAEAVTTAAAAEAITAAAAAAAETILSGKERVELVLSKPIPLVASPSATTSVKTHVYERTFAAPHKHSPGRVDVARRASGKMTGKARHSPAITSLTRVRYQ
jgi:hypothetical protein